MTTFKLKKMTLETIDLQKARSSTLCKSCNRWQLDSYVCADEGEISALKEENEKLIENDSRMKVMHESDQLQLKDEVKSYKGRCKEYEEMKIYLNTTKQLMNEKQVYVFLSINL
ncbi:hypothetical protein HELRODRAFT_165450 [Helobdella robusta]|uniref:Uncharacterized protein n=1 Tax=Helobdella robusta TaxID=6412 RepID=T1EWT7_HELRO|nr:hypothetical protein HELRODRAFT_165450 [Helobdella robusta]ESN91419.1 hypothetical protein HELRODRAFT_165450 [Helobdella robusta]